MVPSVLKNTLHIHTTYFFNTEANTDGSWLLCTVGPGCAVSFYRRRYGGKETHNTEASTDPDSDPDPDKLNGDIT